MAGGLLSEQVGHQYVEADVLERGAAVVVDGERAAEGLARHHELLVELQLDGGADALAFRLIVDEQVVVGRSH